MNFESIIIAAATFFIIGIFHPIVIKAEYYFSKKIWPVFFNCRVRIFSRGDIYLWSYFYSFCNNWNFVIAGNKRIV